MAIPTFPIAGTGIPTFPGSGAPPPFTPEQIASLILDLNADTVPGTDGTAIATWSNQASTGSTNDYTQATGGNKPLLKTNTLNGTHSSILFNGTNQWMTSTGMSGLSTAWTEFFVFKLTATPGSGTAAFLANTRTNAGFIFSAFGVTNIGGYKPYHFVSQSGTVTASGLSDALDTAWHIIGITYNNGNPSLAASYTATLDGTTKTVVLSGASGFGTTNLNAIGAVVAPGPSATSPWNGHMHRRLTFAEVLSPANYTAVTNYLHAYTGI